jgi:4-nitrophenyl phosphatase
MIRGAIFDLDGTVYLLEEQVPGAADFICALRSRGIRSLFVTNRSNRLPSVVVDQLTGFGIDCTEDDVLTSAQATARHLKSGSVFYIGEPSLGQVLEKQGLVITDQSPDYVVVSFDRQFSYDKLKKACQLIHCGATFVATNPDKALKTSHGLLPGTGAIVAAVAAGSGSEPVIIGKPERLIMDMALNQLNLPPEDVICIGDNIETDIPAGQAAGMRTALILTGVTREFDKDTSCKPDLVARNYAELQTMLQNELPTLLTNRMEQSTDRAKRQV